ncbi:MAG: M55 family metallopeptidase [Eubacteriaceae bacterium]|nr:M55 family metallopeptidase [Eubacteriaceae bacterium]
MKVYISSDIEGTCGICHWDETDYDRGGRWYDYFREQMSKEAASAARGAFSAGASEVTVKDAHDSARNLIPSYFPKEARFIRGWPGNPECMIDGIGMGYDAAAFTGYHSNAGSAANPLAHTMTTKAYRVWLNNELASEFMIHAYAAMLHKAKPIFVSGDESLCIQAEKLVPGIVSTPVVSGMGGGSFSLHPEQAAENIETGMKTAVERFQSIPQPKLPDSFEAAIEYAKHEDANRMSHFPGASRSGTHSVSFSHSDYYEILRFFLFVL